MLNSMLYLCCQPGYFTEGLDYREAYVPKSSSLYGTVSMFYEISSVKADTSFFVIPDGCVDMVVSFSEGSCRSVSVCGTISNLYTMELTDCDYIFGMRFMPGKFPLNMIGDIEEYIDEQKNIGIYSREQAVITGLVKSADFYERINCAAAYIASVSETAGYKEKVVEYAMERICGTTGNISIKALSNEMVYSQRYIERIFKEYTGFTPKNMCKIVRAHKALMMLLWDKKASRTDVSMDCGYSDLSHMNRELKNVMGINSDMINFKDFYSNDAGSIATVYKF